MIITLASFWAIVIPIIVAVVLLRYGRIAIRSSSLPPGPSTIPFLGILTCYDGFEQVSHVLLGNLHQIPTTKAYLRFQKWSKTYGPILGLKVGPGNLIVLNSATAVKELFEKRGAIYSSRPPNHIGAELITRGNTHLLLMPYGQEWRDQRKVYQSILSITAVTALQPLQAAEATLTMSQLLRSPEKYYDHIRRYSTAVILSSVFGIRGPTFDHPNIQRLYDVQDQFTAILETGATPPVDIFPFLKYLPTFLAPWRKWALSIRAKQHQLYFELLKNVQDRMQRGIHRICFMDDMLSKSKRTKYALDDEHIAYIGGVLMEGGSDTTASTILSFLMAMIKYPSVLRRAQAEVDKVCGVQRSPNFEDIGKLEYIRHCMTETLRWRPVAAGGIPHTLTEDDVYQGYHFPKGSTFLANTWAIHHDREVYDRPEDFTPERYEKNLLGFKDSPEDSASIRKTYAFGAGRRICPGQHLAESSLLINMAKLVWVFDILPGKDNATGKQLSSSDIDDSIATGWTNGFLTAPKEFPVSLVMRSPKHARIIDEECAEAQEVFKAYED
ncbi:hypothetical protein FOVG_19938 [Fusarium oxysporum f. sp. pisi HDV247]|uniref:Cytochrome P450 n=1 Tax=Fusarium oxysporum f. sp. pisi HDV247 TaxID=1080344 RepID=W9N6V1_FUSOX|nr:hypothetical protein FOVG_19938 [Fusarium oxysporum f. sp. pisi HDV247]